MRRAYLDFMGVIWSMREKTLKKVLSTVEKEGHVPDLDSIEHVRQVKRAPRNSGVTRITLGKGY